MSTGIGEPVKVMAIFDRTLRPVKFRWRDRVHVVKEITHTWNTKEGGEARIHFSVTDGATLFELTYNRSTLKWSLERVETL